MFPSSKNIDGSNIDLTNYYTKTEVNAIVNSQGRAYIPCGSVQAFMTTTAPQGYLICDGTEYLKTQYPQLAEVLAAVDTAQETTLFVGSDADHFKVPDLRGEFLRGTGTNSHTNQGSGANVGTHQDSTSLPDYGVLNNGQYVYKLSNAYGINNSDKVIKRDILGWYLNSNLSGSSTPDVNVLMNVRPTNTSENMIIAYKDIYLSPRHEYSTDEHIVGTWINNKPIYEKTIPLTYAFGLIPPNTWTTLQPVDIDVDTLIDAYVISGDTTSPTKLYFLTLQYNIPNSEFKALHARSIDIGIPSNSYIVAQYTKTTDTV